MSGVAARVLFEAHGRSQVDPGNQQGCWCYWDTRNLLENTLDSGIYGKKAESAEKKLFGVRAKGRGGEVEQSGSGGS